MTRLILILTVSAAFFTNALYGQADEYKQYLLKQNLPDNFRGVVTAELKNQYELSDFINPFYLLADFNGDQHTDIAVTVREIKTGKTGIIVFHADKSDHHVLGAGVKTGNGGDNFYWIDIWKVYEAGILEPGAGETEIVKLKVPAIYLAKAESASAVIYWTGTEYKWYQQGD